jgi:TadE-like protein
MRSIPCSAIGSPNAACPRGRERGQSLVEFALVLTPLFLILLGIVQFGFIFNTYVTMTNSAREGARQGTVFICSEESLGMSNWSKSQCDLARNNAIKLAVTQSMNMLSKVSPQFAVGSTWTQSGNTFTNGDLTIDYCLPSPSSSTCPGATVLDTDARTGYQLTITAAYHQDLIVPLIASLLPKDAGGRLRMTGQVTMVIN